MTSKNKSSLHTFPFSWSTMSGTSVGNFVQILLPGAQEKKLQSCATEKTRDPQNTNRSSQPHCLSIFCILTRNSENLCDALSSPLESIKKKTPCSTEKSLDFSNIRLIVVGCAPAGGTAPAPASLQSAPGVEKMPKKRGKSSKFPTLPGEIELV